MWALICALQFMVFIGKWAIQYTDVIQVVLNEFRRIALGEFVDDLNIGKKFMELLQIESDQNELS